MEKFLSATMLMPLLINQEYAEQLIDRFLKASDHQKQKIIEDASELNQKPVIKKFHFPTKATKTKNATPFLPLSDPFSDPLRRSTPKAKS